MDIRDIEIEQIFDAIPSLMFLKDKENNIIKVNQTFAVYMGITKENIEGKSCFMLWPSEAESYWADDKKVMESGVPKLNIIESMKTAKENRWVKTDKIPYRDKNGSVIGIIGVSTDVTDLVNYQNEIKRTNIVLRNMLDKVPFGVYLINETGVIEFVNKAMLSINGDTYQQFTSLNIFELESYKMSGMDKLIRDGLAGKDSKLLAYHHTSYFAKKTTLRNMYIYPYQEEGRPKVIIFVEDITDRQKSEEALRLSESRFKDAFENAVIGMDIVSIHGKWIKVNKAFTRMLGYTNEEMATKKVYDITHPEDHNKSVDKNRDLLAGKIQYYVIEKRYIHKDGHIVWMTLSVSLAKDANGNPLYYIGQMNDITERVMMENELKKKIRDLERFQRVVVGREHKMIELKGQISELENKLKKYETEKP